MIAAATGIGGEGGLWTVTEVFNKLSEKDVGFSGFVDACSVDPVSIISEPNSKPDGAEGELLFSEKPGDESRFTSVSEKKILVIGLMGSRIYTDSSEVIESKVSIFK